MSTLVGKAGTHQLRLLVPLLLHLNQLGLDTLHLILKHLQLLRINPLVLGKNRLIPVLPPFVVLLEQLNVVFLRLDFSLESLNLFLEGIEFGKRLTKLGVELSDLAKVGFVLVAKGLVALAKELGGVDAFEQLGVLGGRS